MNRKNILVSFLTVMSILFLVATVSAVDYTLTSIEVNDVLLDLNNQSASDVAVIAGETVKVEVRFEANVTDSDVQVQAELEGDKGDVEARTNFFDVEDGKRYRKVLNLRVPHDLDDELSDEIELNVEIDGDDSNLDKTFTLRVQRPSFNTDIKLISTPQVVDSGEIFPVNVVLENVGYNDLDDVFVTVSIPALGVEQTDFLGDIVAIECDDDFDDRDPQEREDLYGIDVDRRCDEDDEDTLNARVLLEVPFEAESGVYTLEVTVDNEDLTSTAVKEIVIENDFTAGNVISTTVSKSVGVGEEANYEVLIVNPTNKLKVYRVITESSSDLKTSASPAVVAVPAGSSKTVTVSASAASAGEFSFNVNVFSNDELLSSVALNLETEGGAIGGTSSPVVVLTVILAIIFIVLLIVLIVLLGKKPEKSEEFGESYY
ncbi:MAG: hypothetical protein ACE5ES_02450 [Candidatus Nanoarchaeia archaeon]